MERLKFYWACDNLSMLGLKFNHVSKMDTGSISEECIVAFHKCAPSQHIIKILWMISFTV